jgi:microcin C transport system substrate-binding protein
MLLRRGEVRSIGMQRVFSKFIGMMVLGILLAGWASQSLAAWTTNENFPLIGDPQAKKGGSFNYAFLSYPATFRVHGPESNTQPNSMMSALVYEYLIGIHPTTLEYIPALAEAWEIQDDNRTFLFRINANAKWEDGQPVTPEDVVFSWELVTDPNTQDPYGADLYTRMFEKPEVVDAHTVKFVAKSLDWRNFLYCGTTLPILPAHTYRGKNYVKDFNWSMPNGSGPYKLASFKKGDNIVFKRRDDYWAKDARTNQGLYNFDQLKFVVVRDQNLMFERFKKGELDFYYVNISKEWKENTDFDKVQKGWVQKRKIYTAQPEGVAGLALNMRRPPLDDIRVRKALAYLYNRPVFMEKLFYNEYEDTYSYFPGSVYENLNNEKIGYDPEKASQLLAEAGWSERNENGILVKDGKPLVLNVLYSQKTSERYLTIYQEDLKKAGIDLKLTMMDWMARIKLTDERNFDIADVAWTGMVFPNVESDFHSKYADIPQTNNITGIKKPEIDAILDQYPKMFDLKDRIAALQKLDALIYQEQPYVLDWYGPFSRILYWNRFGIPASYFTKIGDYNDMLSMWWYEPDKDKALQDAVKNNTQLPVGDVEVDFWGVKQKAEK